jgi:TolB protein
MLRALRTVTAIGSLILLLLAQAAAAEPIAYLAYTDGFWQAWVMDADGDNARVVTTSAYDKNKVSWSPDGKRILISGSQGETRFVDIAAGTETEVDLGLAGVADAVLSYDGTRIAFSAVAAGTRDRNDIWVQDLANSQRLKVTNIQGLQHEPAWSPDGKAVYFLSRIPEEGRPDHDIYRLTFPSSVEQLTSGSGYHFDISVRDDGALLYSNNSTGDYEVWLQLPSKAPVNLSNNSAKDSSPGFSPDGKAVVFESSRDGVANIWVMSLDQRDASKLTSHARGARAPVWFRGEADE